MLDRRLTATQGGFLEQTAKGPCYGRGGSDRGGWAIEEGGYAGLVADADFPIKRYPAWVAYTELASRRERAHPCTAD